MGRGGSNILYQNRLESKDATSLIADLTAGTYSRADLLALLETCNYPVDDSVLPALLNAVYQDDNITSTRSLFSNLNLADHTLSLQHLRMLATVTRLYLFQLTQQHQQQLYPIIEANIAANNFVRNSYLRCLPGEGFHHLHLSDKQQQAVCGNIDLEHLSTKVFLSDLEPEFKFNYPLGTFSAHIEFCQSCDSILRTKLENNDFENLQYHLVDKDKTYLSLITQSSHNLKSLLLKLSKQQELELLFNKIDTGFKAQLNQQYFQNKGLIGLFEDMVSDNSLPYAVTRGRAGKIIEQLTVENKLLRSAEQEIGKKPYSELNLPDKVFLSVLH